MGAAENCVSRVWGGGRGGGCVGASGSVRPGAASSLGLAPTPQAREGARHSSPFRAACEERALRVWLWEKRQIGGCGRDA